MTKTTAQLAEDLLTIAETFKGDPEAAHVEADNLLLDYINDPAVSQAYKTVSAWYA